MYRNPPPSEWDEWPETKAAFEAGWHAAFRTRSEAIGGLGHTTREDADLARAYYDGHMAGTEALIEELEKSREEGR